MLYLVVVLGVQMVVEMSAIKRKNTPTYIKENCTLRKVL